MSLFAVVTFDLHGAKSPEYQRVKRRLGRLRLKKQLHSKNSDTPTRLPANTFAAKFIGKCNEKTAKELRNHLTQKVCVAIAELGLRATIFVAVGDKWAWSKKSVKP